MSESEPVYLTLPIYWQQSQRKTVLVSMNAYRNWHYRVAHKFKVEFAELVHNQLVSGMEIPSPYKLELELFYKNANCDGSNIAPLIEKVVLDVLTEAGITEGDSVKHHIGTVWTIAGQDKDDPRCDIRITGE